MMQGRGKEPLTKAQKIKKCIVLLIRIAAIASIVIGTAFLARLGINGMFVREYNSGEYSEIPEKLGMILNYGEPYVVPYNLGNVAFQNEEYERAIQYYLKARSLNPPEEKECMVRINLALTICHTIDFDNLDLEDNEAIDKAIKTLYEARGYLTENGCASEGVDTSDGHSEDAEKLKHDIDKKIQELQQQKEKNDQQQEQQDQQNQDKQDQNQNEDQSEEQTDQSSQDDQEQQEEQEQDKEQSAQEKEEQERQEDLKAKLKEQKKELRDNSDPTKTGADGHTYQEVENEDASGYGEGMPW